MIKKILGWWQIVKSDIAAATTPEEKMQVLESARQIADGILSGHPVGMALIDTLITEVEKTIR